MGRLRYYTIYIVNWVITLLPLTILYVFSDLLFLVLYYFPSYRRKVVAVNLRNSFPDKSEKELRSIGKKFYRHLADILIETLKLAHLKKAQLMNRMTLSNPELLGRLYSEGRDIAAVVAHYNNWEWLQSVIFYTDYQVVSIYKPLQDKQFDKFILGLREMRGMILTPMSGIVREILKARSMGRRSIYSFITDQTPPVEELRYWTNFLNQETPVYLGAEKIALKYDMAVVFFNIEKIKRGKYRVTAEILFESTSGLTGHVITERHVSKLEEVIREHPEFWIWSHRRWKHKKTPVT